MSQAAPSRLQVLLCLRPGAASVAGLPCVVRAAFRAGRELSPDRIVVAGADDAFLDRWSFQFRATGTVILTDRTGASALDPRLPLLAVDADAFPDENGLAEFMTACSASQGDCVRRLSGRTLAALRREPVSCGAGADSPAEVHAKALQAPGAEKHSGAFLDTSTKSAADYAASTLYGRLAKDNDGYIARLDRRLSLVLTRLLLPLPVTPNQVTAASLLLGLLGAWKLASPSAREQFWGATILWFCCLLDGCDGEIARLKHHCTSWGGEFDLLADHIAHLATFVPLPIGAARLHPGRDWSLPGLVLVSGFIASGYSVYRLILRLPEKERGPLSMVVERIASRDYVYLICALAAVGRLDWFVWTAAIGSHVFWAWLWWVSGRTRAAASLNPRPQEGPTLPQPIEPS